MSTTIKSENIVMTISGRSAELKVGDTKEKALAIFAGDNGLSSFVKAVDASIKKELPTDLSVAKNRAFIKSQAYKYSTAKAKIAKYGRELVEDKKATIKAVISNIKKMEREFDLLRDDTRKTVTDWENKEKERVQSHKQFIERISNSSRSFDENGERIKLSDLKEALAFVSGVVVDSSLEEFELDAIKARDNAIKSLEINIKAEEKRIADELELERLQKAELKRQEEEKKAELKRKAVEEERARAEKERVKREAEVLAEKLRLKAEKEAAEKARLEAIEAKKQAEIAAKEAAERAEAQRIQAEKDRIEAKKQAEIAAKEAAEKARLEEIKRQEAEKARIKAEQDKREANRKHISKIRTDVKLSLIDFCGLDEETAKKVVLAISKGDIKHTAINY